MIGLIKDLPDWATGTVAAGALWASVCYVTLAPRAMEAYAQKTIAPSCVATLEREQAEKIAEAKRQYEEERQRTAARLRSSEQKLEYAEEMVRVMNQSGVNDLMKGFGLRMGDMTQGDLKALRR
ncbi:MAG: hypothetical protein AAFR88_13065, partial [Pseudomonadota bacterium]